jgi:hypothetical protein
MKAVSDEVKTLFFSIAKILLSVSARPFLTRSLFVVANLFRFDVGEQKANTLYRGVPEDLRCFLYRLRMQAHREGRGRNAPRGRRPRSEGRP